MNEKTKKGLQQAMRLCSRSEKCAKDIKDKLRQWQIDEEAHQEIIQQLYEQKFLDDVRYTECYVNDKIYLSKWGKQKVRFALKYKEISEFVIEDALALIDEERYLCGLEKLLASKRKTVKASTDYEKMAKLIRFGQSRGFTISEINKALNNVL